MVVFTTNSSKLDVGAVFKVFVFLLEVPHPSLPTRAARARSLTSGTYVNPQGSTHSDKYALTNRQIKTPMKIPSHVSFAKTTPTEKFRY
ncbi:hypothetical protein HOLleu_20797 [Holothuria leucospilota]|uniref:Uncharacterized protein n=1 Tax=Holothuria leucospilota TaxID=206669 RepID=A0A9Q1C192_HOLLE|nr:hypothetical protein HOLleu_20797 [Holothuria leucospilota]